MGPLRLDATVDIVKPIGQTPLAASKLADVLDGKIPTFRKHIADVQLASQLILEIPDDRGHSPVKRISPTVNDMADCGLGQAAILGQTGSSAKAVSAGVHHQRCDAVVADGWCDAKLFCHCEIQRALRAEWPQLKFLQPNIFRTTSDRE